MRNLYEQNGNDKIETNRLLEEFEELSLLPFGSLLFEFYSYDLDSASMRDYSSDANMTKAILKEQAGIKYLRVTCVYLITERKVMIGLELTWNVFKIKNGF